MGATNNQHMVRVTKRTHHVLRELVRQTGQFQASIIEHAVEPYGRAQLVEFANAQWAALLSDPATRAALASEDAF